MACSAGERRDWALARAEIWPPSDENQYAVLRLSRYSDTVAALPEEELQVRGVEVLSMAVLSCSEGHALR